MKITQKQLMAVLSAFQDSLVIVNGFSVSRDERVRVWEEIYQQQSDEVKEISDERIDKQ